VAISNGDDAETRGRLCRRSGVNPMEWGHESDSNDNSTWWIAESWPQSVAQHHISVQGTGMNRNGRVSHFHDGATTRVLLVM